MKLHEVNIHLPDWVEGFLTNAPEVFPSDEDRMRFVLALARRNVHNATGGPFAAAVFDSDGRLIAPGVNMVVASQCSIFHSEIVALALSQKVLGRYDISDAGKLHYDLFTTTEPCAMCSGAIPWSGVLRLVCGARDEDARAVGFDEGYKIDEWVSALNKRDIAVLRDVLRTEAVVVLQDYVKAGGPIYHAGRPGIASHR